VSTDGTIKWWDVRHLRQPTDSYSLSRESEQQDTNPTRFGASCLAYKSDAGVCKRISYMVKVNITNMFTFLRQTVS